MITIKELLKACQEQVAKGNGDKGVLLSRDEDCDSVTSCSYLFTEYVFEYVNPEAIGMSPMELSNCVILG